MFPIWIDGLTAKIETTYGTDAAPTPAADGVRLSQRVFSALTIEHAFLGRRDDAVSGRIVPVGPTQRLGRVVTAELAVEIRGAGVAYSSTTPVRPEMDPLLMACASTRTHADTVGTETVAYTPADTGHESITVYAYGGNKLYRIVGCRGAWRWPLTPGLHGTMLFTLQGIMVTDPVEAAVPQITYNAELPPPAENMNLTIGTWAPERVIASEFLTQADVQRSDSATAPEAVRSFDIARLDPRYTIQTYVEDLVNFDPYENAQNATSLAIDQDLGTVQYNRVKLSLPSAFIEVVNHNEQQSFAAWALEAQATDYELLFD